MTRVICFFAAVGLLHFPAPSFAQPSRSRIRYEGTEAFRNILHIVFGCAPLQDVADLNAEPRQTVLIVFGNTGVLDRVKEATGGLSEFRKRGGAILIASEEDDKGRLASLGYGINNWPLKQAENRAYRRLPECPVARPKDSRHPLFVGLTKGIATHLPGSLRYYDKSDLKIYLSFSSITNRPPEAEDFIVGLLPFLAAGGEGGQGTGRAVILADRSVFTNVLMIRMDNDNFAFAVNTLRWLTEDGRRKRVLFLDDGEIQRRFDVPLATLPPTRIPTEIINRVVCGLEEENRLNQMFLEQRNFSSYLRAALWGATLLLLFVGLRRLLQGRYRLEAGAPLLAREATLALEAPAVFVQRRRQLVRSDNVWEAARDLARACFEAPAVTATARPPVFVVRSGNWRQRWRLGRMVRRLWELAYGPVPFPVSLRRLGRIQAEAAEVQAALEAGVVEMIPQPSPPQQ
jgi:hypothetical protein